MCGIFGYIGKEISYSKLLEALRRLEYRGYDSCGIASFDRKRVFLKKRPGKINQLRKDIEKKLNQKTSLCILHTRWATHGSPTKRNAHPHFDSQKKIVIVHNGIIENSSYIKNKLKGEGYKFTSETDSEVIAHLIRKFYKKDLKEAVSKAVGKLEGAFALGVISADQPDILIAARKGSPLIVGVGKEGNFLASDLPALLPFAGKVIYLRDEEIAVLAKEKAEIFNFKKEKVWPQPKPEKVKFKAEEAEKKGYRHFMLKEIYEQPQVLAKLLSLYCRPKGMHFPGLKLSRGYLCKIKKIYIAACGTAYHAGYVAKYFLEKHCGVDVEIDTSSEFRYRNLNIKKGDLLIAISQSGETADTLAAVRQAKKKGAHILSICNILGSTLARESNSLIATCAGPEIGVASTKAYTAQLLCFFLFSVYLGRIKKTIQNREAKEMIEELKKIPYHQQQILKNTKEIRKISKKFSRFGSFLFLGRGMNYPLALEGALKLKEISYIPAEGYPAGEMKHGPIALIDEYRAVVCIAPRDELYGKMISNMQEAKARKGKVLAIVEKGDTQASSLSDNIIYTPKIKKQEFNPFLSAMVLQLLAYFVADNLGCEIDQPRNLAKSVTVE